MVDLSNFSLVDTGMHGPGAEQPFYFLNKGSDTLLVTVGDSWTWGADLTDSDEEEYRRTHCYARQVADHFKYDLLNLGQRGSSNFWIAQKVAELEKIVPTLAYSKIIVICMFTEVGRGVNSWYDKDFDFIDWYTNNVSVKTDFYKFLHTINASVVDDILKIEKFDHVKVLFGTNMVDPIGMDKANHLLRPWFRLIADKLGIDQPPEPVYIMHSIAASPIKSTIDMVPENLKTMFLEWVIDLITQASTTDYLFANKTAFKAHHPLTLGHTVIAQEIIKEIKSW